MIIKKVNEWLYVRKVVREFNKSVQRCDMSKRIRLRVTSEMYIGEELARKLSIALVNKYKKLGEVKVYVIMPECSFSQNIDLIINGERWEC